MFLSFSNNFVLFQMNQPQQLNVTCDFLGFLVCQMPTDVVEVKLKIKTKWGKFTLHKDLHTRTEKYRPWNNVSWRVKIHSRRWRQPCHDRTAKEVEAQYNPVSTDSGTFITSSYGMGYPPKSFTYVDSGSDTDVPLHIPNLEEYCRTCISKKTKCICKPLSDWDADLRHNPAKLPQY